MPLRRISGPRDIPRDRTEAAGTAIPGTGRSRPAGFDTETQVMFLGPFKTHAARGMSAFGRASHPDPGKLQGLPWITP